MSSLKLTCPVLTVRTITPALISCHTPYRPITPAFVQARWASAASQLLRTWRHEINITVPWRRLYEFAHGVLRSSNLSYEGEASHTSAYLYMSTTAAISQQTVCSPNLICVARQPLASVTMLIALDRTAQLRLCNVCDLKYSLKSTAQSSSLEFVGLSATPCAVSVPN